MRAEDHDDDDDSGDDADVLGKPSRLPSTLVRSPAADFCWEGKPLGPPSTLVRDRGGVQN